MTLSRRAFLARSSAAFASLVPLSAPALALSQPLIGLECLHTGRSCAIAFDGSLSRSDADAFRSVTRDWRANEIHKMDLRLIEILSQISRKAGAEQSYGLLSGYRTPNTNGALRGTATRSLHMHGRALDIRRDDMSTHELSRIARELRLGGVGTYPQARNRFVHVDTGAVRYW